MPRSSQRLTREAVLSAIRAAARRLGRPPTRAEFTRSSGISHFKVLAHFSSLREAVRQAGLEPNPQGLRISSPALLGDWARVARKLGCLPSRNQYLRHGLYSAGVFTLRFGSWTGVPRSFARFARDSDWGEEWKDVLAHINASRHDEHNRRDAALPRLAHDPIAMAAPSHDLVRLDTRRGGAVSLLPSSSTSEERRGQSPPLPPPLAGQRCITQLVLGLIVNTLAPQDVLRPQLPHDQLARLQNFPEELARLPLLDSPPVPSRPFLRDRPVLGAPLTVPGLAYQPVNETGVVFLFGMLAPRLGFQVESLQAGFPDCEATREIQPGKWQRVRIEFEFESRNFQTHRHPTEACDVIVCWRHNWPECPENLEVVELRRVLRRSEFRTGQ